MTEMPDKIYLLSLDELHPFENHPFKIQNNDDMKKLTESIKNYGVVNPIVVRPLNEGGYEVISGNRRLAACKALGLETMPVVVRTMDDDEAIIAMVDSNLQRESILPSERAFAYKMKYNALKHQGRSASSQLETKLRSDDFLAQEYGESRAQVQRYIRLTYLHPDILMMVDDKKIALTPAVELSFLSMSDQIALIDAMKMHDCTPSHAQSIRLKLLSQQGILNSFQIYRILSEEKPNQQEHISFKAEEFKKYFPRSYSEKQMKNDIIKGLELLRRQRERDEYLR